MPTPLKPAQKRYLRGLAHRLKPVLTVGGKGVTEAVLGELDCVLDIHELVKVRVASEDRGQRDAAIARLASGGGAELVQRIGNTAVLFRPRGQDPRIMLPR